MEHYDDHIRSAMSNESQPILDESVPDQRALLNQGLASSDVPKIYTNGFTIGLTNADVNIVLQRAGQPVAMLFMSYTLAKTLREHLDFVVNKLEGIAGQEILTTKKMDEAIRRSKDG